MKKLLITVNGQKYEVEVEVLEDDEATVAPTMPFTQPHHAENNYQPHYANNREDLFYKAHSNKPGNNVGARPAASGSGKKLNSPVNGTVLEILVKPGDHVNEKEAVIAIEAMKMKTNIYSDISGTIKSIDVRVGDSVETGQLLVTYE